ncbi:MAG TPA: MarR family transcriptional regulator [Acidimicrobiales bacterium]|nr:MarR family transcriptional regulator [Acidimicrobiales bacterium]
MPGSRPRPGCDDALAEVERALTRLLRQMTRPAFYRWLAAAGGVHLDRADYGVLVRIDEAAPVRMTDLAESLGIDISTVSRHVRGLERSGLVQRTGDPDDQRASRLSLSEEGQDVLRRVRRTRQEAMRRLLAEWSEADRAQLAQLIVRLSDEMDSLGQVVSSSADTRAPVTSGSGR